MKAPLPVTIGRYQVRERLAEGGMGVLYLAVDPIIDRLVAIKLLRVNSDEELAERFAREARAAGRLLHPNIITIFDVGNHDGQPFIAMEYITGETIGELVRRRAPLPLTRKVRMMADLCDGLAFAHRSGIVHRDIKPANIMVTREGILKILDFGIAHLADSRMTQTGAFMGTPSYMSPEQISGKVVDHRSDIFAVGLVLYELLAYKQAFQGDTPIRVTHKILTEQPPPLVELAPTLSPSILEIVRRAIEKDPGARYPDVSVMRADLLRAIERDDSSTETVVEKTRKATPQASQTGDRDGLSRRRAAQIESHLNAARAAFAEGRFEDAVNTADQAAMLDPDEARAHDLIVRAREAMVGHQVRVWLEEARQAISRGALTVASELLARTLTAQPGENEAVALQRELRSLQRAKEIAAERSRLIERALEHAREWLSEGAYEPALRSANEVLAQDPDHPEAQALKAQAQELVAADRQKAEQERRVRDMVSGARRKFDAGRREAAIEDLERFDPPHEDVVRLLADLRREDAEARKRDELRRAAEAKAAEEARAAAAQRAEEARLAERARIAAQRAEEAQAAERAREAARQAEEAQAAERAREAARQAEDARVAEHAREAARQAEEARAAERAREAARQAEAAQATERAREAARQAADAAKREAELRAAEKREEERLAAEAQAALEETRLAEAARDEPLQETMFDKRGAWHASAPPPVAHAESHHPRVSTSRAVDQPAVVARPDVSPERSRWKLVGLASAAAAALVVGVFVMSRLDRTPSVATAPTTTTAPEPARPADAAPAIVRLPVVINAVPWAAVRIIPKDASRPPSEGITPFVAQLPEGDYTLEFRNELFAPLTQPLSVRSGERASVSVTMPGADLDRMLNDVLGGAQ